MAAVTDLFDACNEYLEACQEAVALAPGGAIQRAYVSPGPPAFDCTQLTVHAGGPSEGDTAPLQPPMQPLHRIGGSGMIPLVAMTATVIRCCVPVVEQQGQTIIDPDPADIQAAAAWTLGDCWAIWNHVITRKLDGTLFAGPNGDPKSRELILDPAVAVNTAGGCAGWQLQIRVELGGVRI